MKNLIVSLLVLSLFSGCSSFKTYEVPKNVQTARVRVAVEAEGLSLSYELGRVVMTELMDQNCENRFQLPGYIKENRSRESLIAESAVIDRLKAMKGKESGSAVSWADRINEFEVEAGKGQVFDFLYRESDRSSSRELSCGLKGMITFAPGDNVEVRYRVIQRPNGIPSCELKAFNVLQSTEAAFAFPRPIFPVSCNPIIFR